METIVTVRPGEIDDLGTFAEFWIAMFEEIGNLSRADMRPDWRERFVDYMARRMRDGEGVFYVAVEDGAIVATAGAIVADGYPFAVHGIARGYIFGVRTEPAHRGKGLAADVTLACARFLKEAGCKRIRLHASRFGRRVYEKLGFVPTNEMEIEAGGVA